MDFINNTSSLKNNLNYSSKLPDRYEKQCKQRTYGHKQTIDKLNDITTACAESCPVPSCPTNDGQ